MNASNEADPTGDFSGDIQVSKKLPSKADLEKAANLPVLDVSGKPHAFKTLLPSADKLNRVLIIFIRHFFCGVSASFSITDPPLSEV